MCSYKTVNIIFCYVLNGRSSSKNKRNKTRERNKVPPGVSSILKIAHITFKLNFNYESSYKIKIKHDVNGILVLVLTRFSVR